MAPLHGNIQRQPAAKLRMAMYRYLCRRHEVSGSLDSGIREFHDEFLTLREWVLNIYPRTVRWRRWLRLLVKGNKVNDVRETYVGEHWILI
jgi:hypothetical protein